MALPRRPSPKPSFVFLTFLLITMWSYAIPCHSRQFQAMPCNAMQCHAILSIPVELLLLNTRVDVQLIMPRAFEINTLINWFNRLWKKKCYRGRFNRWLIVGDGEFVTCFMMDDGNFRFLCGDAGSTLISLINRYLSECVAWIHPPASIDDEDDEEREKERKRKRGGGGRRDGREKMIQTTKMSWKK